MFLLKRICQYHQPHHECFNLIPLPSVPRFYQFFSFLDPPNVTALEPLVLVVNHTQMAKFACQGFGNPYPQIQWVKVSNDSALSDGFLSNEIEDDDINITEMTVDSFTRVSNLIFLSARRSDQSQYACVGSNGITNLIDSPENDIVTLIVQGKVAFQVPYL